MLNYQKVNWLWDFMQFVWKVWTKAFQNCYLHSTFSLQSAQYAPSYIVVGIEQPTPPKEIRPPRRTVYSPVVIHQQPLIDLIGVY